MKGIDMIKNIQVADCFQAGGVKLERVKFFQRQLLTVDDMVTDQDYFRQKMRRHNRFLHGWGVVCGLEVTPAPIDGAPLRVRISEGYALGPFGDEIYVGEPVFLDLGKCGPHDKTDPCNPGRATGTGFTGGTVYVAIEYAECFAQPIRSLPAGFGCDDDGCEYSRIRDSFDLACLPSMPPIDPPVSICELLRSRKTAPCPPCPSSPWVVLAAVILPSSTGSSLSSSAAGGNDLRIDNGVRKNLYRTELLQAQLIECCCGKPTPQPAPAPVQVVVSGVKPAPNATLTPPVTSITIPFTKSLQTPVNSNSVAVSLNGAPLPIKTTLTYTDSTRTIVITTDSGLSFPAGVYKITAFGTGATAIKDTDGLALDGRGTGIAGDYDFTFTINQPTANNPLK
jgi:hypothetical protein